MNYYFPHHFKVQEFVPSALYALRGDDALIVMDTRILRTMDMIRDSFGVPITINNWNVGGPFKQRGFREDSNVGALLSQHRFGRACDFEIEGIPSEFFRDMVRDRQLNKEMEFITRIEDGVDWIHIDCANVEGDEIVFFKK